MTTGLRARGLAHRYGQNTVLDGLDLVVGRGEIVGLLGPNGAGKTTAFKLIAGALKAQSGRITLDDASLNGPVWRRARQGLGYVPQTPSVVKKMSVLENVALGQRARDAQGLRGILSRFGLAGLADVPAEHLSGGERRRVELARAFASDAKILIVDEPFAALDPIAVNEVSRYLRECALEGIGVLLTDHYVGQALDLCHRIYILYEGRVICSGSAEEVAQNPMVRHTYLGGNFPL
jgi:lipopolysaccharide export system ATP-binding protein